MEKLKTLLIANRGEIAVRITKTARALGIRVIAIYTSADATSSHVTVADEAVLLKGDDATAYTDGAQIIEVARSRKVDAIIPGYGFLSENPEFAQAVADAGMVFVGPRPDAIEAFGLKHRAREMAVAAGVPIVPGTKGLVASTEEAVAAAAQLGYPVMLKATGGGGGMGLKICNTADEVRESLVQVQSRGQTLFKNAGVFMERYYPKSHHIEVQVFGNGQGAAIHFGERECSIQRRHQKVVEECPSPFVERHPDLRQKLTSCAVALAESVCYGSAGTIEYLVDDETGDFFFLEMNTRLQVEHGITEQCYGVDLVELMLQQADRELAGHGGLDTAQLKALQPEAPLGASIEVRIYAENPARDHAPSPGLLQYVEWKKIARTRIDTWVSTGAQVSTYYDPMIAKIMVHASTRAEAMENMKKVLSQSVICGPPTNLDFLLGIIESEAFSSGVTLTNFLHSFKCDPAAIDVLSPGVYTSIQDYPGRPQAGMGIPHAGPMDPLAAQIANIVVGNPRSTETLEITLKGPDLKFLAPAVVALCGAPMEFRLDGKDVPMWTRIYVKRGQILSIGKLLKGGCRSYLAVLGGFPSIAPYFGSKSTSPLFGLGGYQGRQLAPGDMLAISKTVPETGEPISIPAHLIPEYTNHWDIFSMVGPYDEGYIIPEDIEMIYNTKWKVSHNATRGGIRLIGPAPRWARENGGDGGAHPSNLIEYGYPLGTLNWTGDDPVIFSVDSPDLGGFVSCATIVKGSLWRMGQLKSGDTFQYRRVSLADALKMRKDLDNLLSDLTDYVAGKLGAADIRAVDYAALPESTSQPQSWGKAVIREDIIDDTGLNMTFRQGGDDFLLIEYGDGKFDLNHRCRVTALNKALRAEESFKDSIVSTIGCCNSLLIHYDGSKLPRDKLIDYCRTVQSNMKDLTKMKVPSRRFRLPICFESKAQDEAIKRYMETQRPYAPYLPDNMDFVAKINGMTKDELVEIFLTAEFMAIAVGFFCCDTICLPIDPRLRLTCPKKNPSRVYTPAGSVSWGGSCMNIYPADAPGGYQLTGQTIPCFDQLGVKPGFTPTQPGIFQDFDQITYYRVSEAELERDLALFRSGRYEFQFEETTFDMGAHNKMLEETRDEVAAFKARQAVAQAKMMALERESLAKWMAEKAKNQVPVDQVESLRQDPSITSMEAPLDANVWKVTVAEGDVIAADHIATILEAMKMEINVRPKGNKETAADKKYQVVKILAQPGGTVKAGDIIMFLRDA
ncbi:hypothetical protein VTO42DRAFT_7871 [Malbranchea cinnamomea]